MRIPLISAGLAALFTANVAATSSIPHHELSIQLFPEQGTIQVHDLVSLGSRPDAGAQARQFRLNPRLKPTQIEGFQCDPVSAITTDHISTVYSIPGHETELNLCYQGPIHQPRRDGDRLRGGHATTAAILDSEGAYLSPAAYWYPDFSEATLSFDMNVQLPDGWQAISQGQGSATSPEGQARWQEQQPQKAIYLVAGPFHNYHQGRSEVYLRSPDPQLAARYLQASEKYLHYYEQILGPYPYAKFATIENNWQTGYGMPSFTLLGSRVIRLPFILHTSFPHEILHNWWGNSVYVDYAQGNWSEGLTTYLADHALAARRGKDTDYRRNALTTYSNYTRDDDTGLALKDFIGRHDRRSQSVGYGKAFFLFHMVRQRIGDQAFFDALRRFARDYQFRHAGYRELQAHFEQAGGLSLETLFRQWLDRADSPALALEQVTMEQTDDAYLIRGEIVQTQPGPVYQLHIPALVSYASDAQATSHQIVSNARTSPFELQLKQRPRSLQADPRFDLFRRLSSGEIPPSIGPAFNADEILMVLPSGASGELKQAYQALAETWRKSSPGLRWQWDTEVETLPVSGSTWVLGRDNRLVPQLNPWLQQHDVSHDNSSVTINGQAYEHQHSSMALVLRRDPPLVWLTTDQAGALPGLGRKLPHYGKYSYLMFEGRRPDNILKGSWPATDSPLNVRFE